MNEAQNPETEDRKDPVDIIDPLSLDIPDDELIKIINKRVSDDKKFFGSDEIDLFERRKKNKMYLFGRQLLDKNLKKKLKKYDSRFQDNILYEIESSIKPLALSRLPDFIVLPGQQTTKQKDIADDLTEVVNDDLRKRENRRVLALAFKHLPVYFTGVIKVLWDNELDDYRFEVVNPDQITVDHTAKSNDANKMKTITQDLPITVQEVMMRFPEKKKEFIEELAKKGIKVSTPEDWKALATEIVIQEVWFKWYKKAEGKDVWETVFGVMWKYGDVLLKKMKNPNFDYEGETRYYSYSDQSDESTKVAVDVQDLAMKQAMGIPVPEVSQEQVYHNYFERPQMPYFFMGYDQWGEMPYDETSRIEQNIRNQEALDNRGKQIEETLANRGKHIFSTDSGLQGKDIERIDPNNPQQNLLVKGNVNLTHGYISPERPTPQEFADKNEIRSRAFSISGATNLTGQLQSSVATSNQIAREANYTRIDDLTEETINAASEWMASWVMQLIKLRYTQEHLKKILGQRGEYIYQKLQRDMIDDGMEVRIKSSGTDKLKAQQNAMDMAKIGPPYTDPLNFFKDMDISDPEGRGEMGAMYASDPQGYIAKYVLKQDGTEQMAQTLMAGDQASIPSVAPAPPVDQAQQPSPENTQQIPAQPPVGPPDASPRIL